MVAKHEYEPVGFTAQNGLKDANLICDAATMGGVDMPIAELVRQRLKTQIEVAGADCDWASFAAQVQVGQEKSSNHPSGGN
jgi:3-hydroxyisobutyrate dehydrogenase-like beta-hydroxyacid dehydrogenase